MRTLATLGAMALLSDAYVKSTSIQQQAKNTVFSLSELSSGHSQRLDLSVHRHHHADTENLAQAAGMEALDARIREVSSGASPSNKEAAAQPQGSLAQTAASSGNTE